VHGGFLVSLTLFRDHIKQHIQDDSLVKAIAQAAKELVEQRDRSLNADLTPDPSPFKRGEQRTLTNLYNARPTWLDLAHKRLDEAVVTHTAGSLI
jgi:hypothetical protein